MNHVKGADVLHELLCISGSIQTSPASRERRPNLDDEEKLDDSLYDCWDEDAAATEKARRDEA